MLKQTSATLKIGDPAPPFELTTAASSRIRLADFRGQCLLIVFIRGTWCPNCTRQMAEFEASYAEFQRRGLNVVFIAAQKREGLFKGKQFIEKHQYPFPLLFDESREVTRDYGVHHALGIDAINIARRSMFLVDQAGAIRWIAVSPHQFEAPKLPAVLAAADRFCLADG